MNVPYLLQNQYFKNDASTQEHTAQLDYTNPINSIHSIETGIKYIFVEVKVMVNIIWPIKPENISMIRI